MATALGRMDSGFGAERLLGQNYSGVGAERLRLGMNDLGRKDPGWSDCKAEFRQSFHVANVTYSVNIVNVMNFVNHFMLKMSHILSALRTLWVLSIFQVENVSYSVNIENVMNSVNHFMLRMLHIPSTLKKLRIPSKTH